LATTDDARVHCAVLKMRAVPSPAAVRLWRSGPAEVGARKRPFPQDPTACSACASPGQSFRSAEAVRTDPDRADTQTE